MKYLSEFLRVLLLCAFALGGIARAQLQAIPPNVTSDPNLPMVVLNASKDFSMFSRAYTDYEDLDFDANNTIDYTFMPYFRYYGYFDATKCYVYTSGSGEFTPSGNATAEAVTISGTARTSYYCSAGAGANTTLWSGNFLNWASMSRMDVLRKILFGGLRSTDTNAKTVLELSFVPRNSQAFVKFYNGSDLNRLTPYNFADGLTLCRRHENTNTDSASQTTTLKPVIRTARGNYLLWNMTEVRTCNWSEEIGYTWKAATVAFMTANYQGAGGATVHQGSTPSSGATGSSELVARVEVCKTGLLGEENCKQYPFGNYKPRGLLHEFGESDSVGNKAARAEFALMLGSYDSNLDGGILRKNMSEVNDEIDSSTGVFLGTAGIIQALSKLRLYGYNPNNGNYSQTCDSRSISNGNCPSWGNPIAEMLVESLRYYAGKSQYFSSGGGKDGEFGLTAATWSDPLTANRSYPTGKTRQMLYGKNQCRPLNMVTISSGISSFDHDNVNTAFSSLSGTTASSYTQQIGTKEGVTGTRLIGNTGATNDDLCTGKNVTDLSTLTGLCPEAPNFKGTYLGAGPAYWGHTNKVRTDLTLPSDANKDALKVNQYAVSMAGGATSIQIPVPGQAGKYVYITPAGFDSLINPPLAGNMVDFKVLNRAADGLSGSFLVLWQHYMLGEDQDQDMLGSIRYEVDTSSNPPKLKLYTQTLESDTGSTASYLFGYTLVGTNSDGFHSHSAINNGYATDNDATYTLVAAGGSGDGQCNNPRKCVRFKDALNNDVYVYGETLKVYNMTGSTNAILKDPLYYIAKYGGFTDSTTAPTGWPDSTDKWDKKRADGVTACGSSPLPSCSDGIPDNYFLARRPDLLEDALRQVFSAITASSNTAPAVSRPDIFAGDLKYVVSFDPNTLQGNLKAYVLTASGTFATTPTYDGSANLTNLNPTGRQITTNVGTTSVAFTYSAISATVGGSLYLASLDTPDARVQAEIQYFRGVRTQEEGVSGATENFRKRVASILGASVNSTPWVQSPPIADFFGTQFSGYDTFRSTWKSRNRLLWFGANDGMLHAFRASDLAPVYSYVPGLLAPRMKLVADRTVTSMQAMMDGSPFTGDVKTSSAWRTYLFSALGRGGKGIFALDVTDTSALTETNAANIFKWQFTAADDADLGYILSEGGVHPATLQAAQIAKFPNGKFGVIFGNGVQSTSGKAVLYILFVDGPGAGGVWGSGTFVKIVADAGPNNGLSQPYWVDTNDDGLADTIYAGDLKGKMWKFDVSSNNPATWGVAYGGTPLYTAVDSANVALPITTAPVVQFHPLGGVVVTFGTGKSIVSGDFPDGTRSYRIFGIWDKPLYTGTPTARPSGVSELQSRTWTVQADGSVIQENIQAINWTTAKGWYIQIPYPSAMVISNPLFIDIGDNILMSISVPNLSTNSCNTGASGLQAIFDPVTGVLTSNLFGTPGTVGVITTDQRATFATNSQTSGQGISRGNIITATGPDTVVSDTSTKSRIYWREIPGLRTLD